MQATMTYESLCRRANSLGLAVRGAFHPEPQEFDRLLPALRVETLILLGFTGAEQWGLYQSSPEAEDGLPDPLDRWSRRIVDGLAGEFGGAGLYPHGAPPHLPFQRFALRGEAVHRSPIGLLIHPEWGLWHAYRGALALPGRIELPAAAPSVSPCSGCAARPCLSTCPVEAFREGSYDVAVCVEHVLSAAGSDCRERGCLARRSCPVGASHRYGREQARFHMSAFLRSARA